MSQLAAVTKRFWFTQFLHLFSLAHDFEFAFFFCILCLILLPHFFNFFFGLNFKLRKKILERLYHPHSTLRLLVSIAVAAAAASVAGTAFSG